MNRLNIHISLWPVGKRYYYVVPTPLGDRVANDGDIGTAVRNAVATAKTAFGDLLGDVTFRLIQTV